MKESDVLIIGAGPAGAAAGALLNKRGFSCQIVERQHFPRFSIGESLLPHCMDVLDEAGFLPAVEARGFQLKDGARFLHRGDYATFEFADQFTPGWGHTFEVTRADFDQILADEAQKQGVDIAYGETIEAVQVARDQVSMQARNEAGESIEYGGRLLLDASGFGRVLPRLLELDRPSSFPVRRSLFTHIEDGIAHSNYDRDKILVTIHPERSDVWIWLIPFSDGRASIGVVAPEDFLDALDGDEETKLKAVIAMDDELSAILANATFDTPVNTLVGYSADVSRMHGPGYALLGNAGEFLDPIFSSGVTIALKSASLAAAAADRELKGETVDWEVFFAEPLAFGVRTFKAFVETWYTGDLQRVFFAQFKQPQLRQMVCSILGGYAWDPNNKYTTRSRSRIEVLAGHSRVE